MDSKARTKLNLVLSGVLLATNLVCANWLLSRTRIFRWDLTEGKHFSLLDETRQLIRELDEPAEIVFYHSAIEDQHEKLRPLIDPLQDILDEFASEGGDHLRVRRVVMTEVSTKVREEAENTFGVRPLQIPVRSAFEDSIKSTYFSVVVSAGQEFEHFPLGKLMRSVDRGESDWELELANIEALVAQALRKVVRGFNSVPGALVARDKKASVNFIVTAPDTLPEKLKSIAETVKKVAEQLGRESGGRLTYVQTNPYEGATSDAEKQEKEQVLFQRHRVRPLPVDFLGEKTFYSWLVIEVDDQVDVRYLVSNTGELGEADVKSTLEGSLKRLIPGFLPTLGLALPKPQQPNPMMMQARPRGPTASGFEWLERELSDAFEVESVDLGSGEIPRKVETLLIAGADALGDQELYAIDQFVMRGGRLVVCADAFRFSLERTQQTREIELDQSDTSKLGNLLAHWGVTVQPKMIEDARCEYLQIPKRRFVPGLGVIEDYERVEYPFFVRVVPEAMDREHPITSSLPMLGLFWATPLEITEKPDIKATVLMKSSAASATVDSAADITKILEKGFTPPADAKSYPVAVALNGRFSSYFADKAIPGLDRPPEPKKDQADPEASQPKKADDAAPETPEKKPEESETQHRGAPLLETQRDTNVVVIGDSDFINQAVFRTFNQSADLLDLNARFLQNCLDWGGPDSDLLRIRNRAPMRRPLTELAGLSDEERTSTGVTAAWVSLLGTLFAILLVAVSWFVYRRSRPPLKLLPPTSRPGGLS